MAIRDTGHATERLRDGLRLRRQTIRMPSAPGARILTGCHRTHILTAVFDPLRDEAKCCTRRLTGARGKEFLSALSGVIHGFFQLGRQQRRALPCGHRLACVASPVQRLPQALTPSSLPPSSYEPEGFAGQHDVSPNGALFIVAKFPPAFLHGLYARQPVGRNAAQVTGRRWRWAAANRLAVADNASTIMSQGCPRSISQISPGLVKVCETGCRGETAYGADSGSPAPHE